MRNLLDKTWFRILVVVILIDLLILFLIIKKPVWLMVLSAALLACIYSWNLPETLATYSIIGSVLLSIPFQYVTSDPGNNLVGISLYLLVFLSILVILIKSFDVNKLGITALDFFALGIFAMIAFGLSYSIRFDQGFQRTLALFAFGFLPFFVLRFFSIDQMKKSVKILYILGLIVVGFSFYSYLTGGLVLDRFFGFTEKDIDYVRGLGVIFILSFYYITRAKKFIHQLGLLLLAFITLYLIILSATRAPLGACVMVSAFYLYFFTKKAKWIKVVFPLITLAALIWFLATLPFDLKDRILQLSVKNDFSSLSRLYYWKTSFEIFTSNLKNFLVGVGTSSWQTSLPVVYKIQGVAFPHNILVESMVEQGIFGLVFMLGFITIPFIYGYRIIKTKDKQYRDISSLMKILIGIYTYFSINTLISEGRHGLWIFAGLINAVWLYYIEMKSRVSSSTQEESDNEKPANLTKHN
ncbi:O-antigen ligase family protein [bacterium]|nr:O-antigen ligase family protein [bacterium]